MNRTIIISGPQGCGKTVLAQTIAAMAGSYVTVRARDLCDTRYWPWLDTDAPPATVIVDETRPTDLDTILRAGLSTGEELIVEQKHKPNVSVPTPHFIFCTGDQNLINIGVESRRFIVVEPQGVEW